MSSDDIAIRTHGLGKRYRLGVERNLTGNLREALAELPARLRRRAADRASTRIATEPDREAFWALRDVDLEVRRGEVVGVVGRNGAGKSTLLKVLSRITAPTTGSAEIHGRVGSLLEVGTGFHPELSGRDNVFLNGAILGMRRREIEAKFDEIVDFAEVGPFLDTPVKRYSSGMRVRLGFAVAAFLEPEILFVDEVLAVGDEGFRKKCLGKMDDIAGTGRTVLFVSHSMTAISSLCSRAVLIDEGRLVHSGGPREVIETYLERVSGDAKQSDTGHFDLRERRNNYGDRDVIVKQIETLDAAFRPRAHFLMGDAMALRVHLEGFSRHPESTLGITIKDAQDQWLASLNTAMSCRGVKEPRSDAEIATLRIERLPLLPGRYYLSISATLGPSADYKRIDYVDRAASFEVVAADVYGSGYPMERKYGVFYLEGDWSIEGGVPAVEGEGESP